MLISDLLDVTKNFKPKVYSVTTDKEKAFDSLDHSFTTTTLKNFDFGSNFVDRIKIFSNDQQMCVISGMSQHNISKLKKMRDKVIENQLICLYYV